MKKPSLLSIMGVSVIATLILNNPTSDAGNLEEESIDIIYAHDRYNPKVRKTLFKLQETQLALKEYDENKNSFRVPIFGKLDQINRWERMSRQQVKEMAWNQANTEVNGFSPNSNRFYKTLTAWAGAIPGIGTTAALVTQTYLGAYETAGKTPSMEDIRITGLGETLTSLGIEESDLRDKFIADYEISSGRSIQDPQNHPVVQEVLHLINTKEEFAKTEETLKGVTGQLERVLEFQNEQVQRQNTLEAEEKARTQYEKKREEILGSFGAMSGALQLMGNREAAQKVDKVGQVAAIAMDLSKLGSKMNPIMMANAYLMAANIVMGMFSSEGDAEKAMMEMMQKILEEIQNLKEEMHNRFDRIDRQLGDMLALIEVTDALNRDRHVSLRAQLDAVEMRLKGLLEKLDMGTIAERKRDINFVRDICLTDDPTKAEFQQFDDKTFNNTCLVPITHLTSKNISFELLNFSYAEYPDVQWGGSFSRPFEAQFPTILKKIADTNQNPIIRRDMLGSVVNYQVWEEMADTFLDLFDKFSSSNPVFSPMDIEKVSFGGRQLASLRKEMLVENGKLRWGVFNALLEEYRSLMQSAATNIKDKAHDKKGFDGTGFDVTQPITQASDFVLPTEKRKLGFCDGGNSKGGIRSIELQGFFGNLESSNAVIGPISMILPRGFETIMPAEFLWLAKKFPSEIGLCVERLAVPTYQGVTSFLPVKNAFLTKIPGPQIAKYSADVRIHFLFKQRALSTAVFTNNYNVTGVGFDSTRWLQYLYSQIWNGFVRESDGHLFPSVFAKYLQARKSAFPIPTKGAGAEYYNAAMDDAKTRWINELDKVGIEHFVVTTAKGRINEIDGLLKVFAGAVFLGINDAVEEKRSVEEAFSEVATVMTADGLVERAGLISLDSLIKKIITENLTREQIDERIQAGIDTIKETLGQLENSGKDLTPETPEWIDSRLYDLDIRRRRLALESTRGVQPVKIQTNPH